MLPETFHLMQNGQRLAVLARCKPIEMFWLACEFQPTEAFNAVRPLFEAASNTEDMDCFHELYDQIDAMGVRLVNAETKAEIRYYVMHLDGDTARLRYADPDDLPS